MNFFTIALSSKLLQWTVIGLLISILIDEAINIICYIKSFSNENLRMLNKTNLFLNILFSCARIYIGIGVLSCILNFNLPGLNFNLPILLFFLASLHLFKSIVNEIELCRKGMGWKKSLLSVASATSLFLLSLNIAFIFYPNIIASLVCVAIAAITTISRLVILLIEKQKAKKEIIAQTSCIFFKKKNPENANADSMMIPIYQY